MSKLGKIHPEIISPQKIQTIPHEAWQASSFLIPKDLLRIIIKMLQSYVKAGVLEYCNELYRNPWFLVKKKCGKYHIVNTAMNANQYTIHDVNLPPNIKEFAKRSAGMAVASLINYYSKYNQVKLHLESHDITTFQT